jgi:hypothetical protein
MTESTKGRTSPDLTRFSISPTGAVTIPNLTTGTVTVSAGVLSNTCDERLKDVRGPFTKGLPQILRMNPKRWSYNKQSGLDTETIISSETAQDLIAAGLMEATHEGKNGFYGVDDRTIIAALINAVKEQQREIEMLKAAA